MHRSIYLDTETTGFSVREGHRVVELAAVEVVEGRRTGREFHTRLNPEREVPEKAVAIHGLSWDVLRASPRFADVAAEWVAFVEGAEAFAHNAPFDAKHLSAELVRAGYPEMDRLCVITDTLSLARTWNREVPNHRLDTLLAAYGVDASARAAGHGALIDARLLADLHAAMVARHAPEPRRRWSP